jgi:hypothetical protein
MLSVLDRSPTPGSIGEANKLVCLVRQDISQERCLICTPNAISLNSGAIKGMKTVGMQLQMRVHVDAQAFSRGCLPNQFLAKVVDFRLKLCLMVENGCLARTPRVCTSSRLGVGGKWQQKPNNVRVVSPMKRLKIARFLNSLSVSFLSPLGPLPFSLLSMLGQPPLSPHIYEK